jgi:RNA polymerase sigma-70 factor, ECF subfamily
MGSVCGERTDKRMTPLLSQRPRADRAFERMYKRHVLDVYRYALVVLPTPQDAEDVTQTTFLNAYRAFQDGERPKAQRNWLMGIAHKVCRRRFRQSARGFEEVELHDAAVAAVPDEEGPTAQDIRRALGRLDFNQRAALVMREVEGRSYQEIAELLERSANDVETIVFRARRALREELEGSLTCHEAERAVSRHLDGLLRRSERASLREHLRECGDCAEFARSQDSQRTALRRYAMVPLPSSLASFFTTSDAVEDTPGERRKFSPSSESF